MDLKFAVVAQSRSTPPPQEEEVRLELELAHGLHILLEPIGKHGRLFDNASAVHHSILKLTLSARLDLLTRDSQLRTRPG